MYKDSALMGLVRGGEGSQSFRSLGPRGVLGRIEGLA